MDKLAGNTKKKIEICKILKSFSEESETNTYFSVDLCVPESRYESVADAIIEKFFLKEN